MTRDQQEIEWRVRVFDSLSYPTRVLKPDGTIIAVNDKFLKIFNESSTSIIGKTCRKTNPVHFPNQSFPCDNSEECPLQKTVKQKVGQSALLHTIDNSGDDKWEDRVFSPILGDDGEVKYVIESFRDVTRINVLERLYGDARELIDKVMQSSVSAIIAANRRGGIILVNKAAEGLFGYPADEIDDIHIINENRINENRISGNMFDQNPPIGKICEDCGEKIEQIGYTLCCSNGCFNDDIRNFYSENYR